MRHAILGLAGRIIMLAVLLGAGRAQAHDVWADGSAVPAWVKSACCGPRDAFVIDAGDVSGPDDHGYYHVKNIGNPVASDHVFDSQDGQTWVFYNPDAAPEARYVYCLFLSRNF